MEEWVMEEWVMEEWDMYMLCICYVYVMYIYVYVYIYCGSPAATIRGNPHEETIQATHSHLQRRDCHGEASLSSSSTQS